MITELLEKPSVLFYYNKIRDQADEKVSKEIAFNLLELFLVALICSWGDRAQSQH